MLGCSTVCPNCKHQFSCCPATTPTQCCTTRRSIHFLSGGGLIATATAPPTATSNNPSDANLACQSPQISPSVPLTFVIPPQFSITLPAGTTTTGLIPASVVLPTATTITTTPSSPTTVVQQQQTALIERPERELEKLTATVQALRQSGWFYEGITFSKSDELLKDTKIGTFLIRNSSDPHYLFSLSMQTEHGPKSVRLCYLNGYFRLDAQLKYQDIMPLFPSVIELVQYYRRKKRGRCGGQINNLTELGHGWFDPQGKWLSSIYLDQPLRKERRPPSLKHLSRMAINGLVCDQKKLAFLNLPPSLASFMEEYPYSI